MKSRPLPRRPHDQQEAWQFATQRSACRRQRAHRAAARTGAAPPPVAVTARDTPRTRPAVEPEVPLQVLVPKSIRKQLGHKAAEEGQSLRALVLRAFRGIGLTVTDDQIEGKRGRRDDEFINS